MKTRQVAVYSKEGKLIGHVSRQATSIGASKIAGAPCELRNKDGLYCWFAK